MKFISLHRQIFQTVRVIYKLSCPPWVMGWVQCGQTQKPSPELRSNLSVLNTVKPITLYYRVSCPPNTSGLLCDDSLSYRELQWFFSPTLTLLHKKYHKREIIKYSLKEVKVGSWSHTTQNMIYSIHLESLCNFRCLHKLSILPEQLLIEGMTIV